MKILQKVVVVGVSAAVIGLAHGALTQSAAAADYLIFQADMVRGATPDGATGPTCVLTSQFKRKEHVVWRVRAFGPGSGEQLGGDGLESLVVALPNGVERKMRFGDHPRKNPLDSFWSVSWEIPEDYPTGSLNYKLVATDLDGKTHEWEPFKIGMSHLTVIEGDVVFTKR